MGRRIGRHTPCWRHAKNQHNTRVGAPSKTNVDARVSSQQVLRLVQPLVLIKDILKESSMRTNLEPQECKLNMPPVFLCCNFFQEDHRNLQTADTEYFLQCIIPGQLQMQIFDVFSFVLGRKCFGSSAAEHLSYYLSTVDSRSGDAD